MEPSASTPLPNRPAQGPMSPEPFQPRRTVSFSGASTSSSRRDSASTTTRSQNQRGGFLHTISSLPVTEAPPVSRPVFTYYHQPQKKATYVVRPSTTVIDIDSNGNPTLYPRVVEGDCPGEGRGCGAQICPEDSISYLPDDLPLSALPPGGVRVVLREISLATAWNMTNIAAGNIRGPSVVEEGADEIAFGKIPSLATRSVELPQVPATPAPAELREGADTNDFMRTTLASLEDQIKRRILNLHTRQFSMRHLQALLREGAPPSGRREPRSGLPGGDRRPSPRTSIFILQSPIYKDIMPEGTALPHAIRLGLDPLLSPSWSFSEALNASGITMTEANALVKVEHRTGGRSIVFCCFPAMCTEVRANGKINEEDALSPALRAFEDCLLSPQSSTKLMNLFGRARGVAVAVESAKLGSRLVILDLMRAIMNIWDGYVVATNANSIETNPLTLEEGRLSQLRDDINHSKRIAANIRDSGACLRYLVETIERDVQKAATMPPPQRSTDVADQGAWGALEHELLALNGELQSQAQDILDRATRNMTSYSACLGEAEGKNATRLTLVAAVFLPLSLSSSLMSMNTHAWEIGSMWVDWVGLSMVLAVLLFLLHVAVKMADNAAAGAPARENALFARLTSSVKEFEGLVMRFIAVAVSGGLFYALVTQKNYRINAWLCSILVALSILILVFFNAHRLRGIWHQAKQAVQLTSFFKIISWTGMALDGSDVLLRQYAKGKLTAFLFSYNGWRVVEALAYFGPLRRWIIEKKLLILFLLYKEDRHAETLRILRRMSAQDENVEAMLKELIEDLQKLSGQQLHVPSSRANGARRDTATVAARPAVSGPAPVRA